MRIAARTATVVCAASVSLAMTQPIAPVAQAVPSVGEIVAAAEKYLTGVDSDERALFAEERSQQTENRYNSRQEQRLLRSNVLMFRDGSDPVWIRDVLEVNGTKVADPPDRLLLLASASTASAQTLSQIPPYTPLQIVTESARQQYGGGFRAVNQPGSALNYLRVGRPGDLPFRVDGWKTVDGAKVVLLTLKDAPGGQAVPFAVGGVQGRFWIEPASGRVLQTELEFIMAAVYRTKITVKYGVDKTLNTVVPIMMNDEYENRIELVTGRAEYRNFRKVTIDPEAFRIGR